MFIFNLRIQLAQCRKFPFDLIFFDRYFLNVGGRSRDLKCAFLGEPRATISCRGLVRAASEINSGAVWKPPPKRKARLWSGTASESFTGTNAVPSPAMPCHCAALRSSWRSARSIAARTGIGYGYSKTYQYLGYTVIRWGGKLHSFQAGRNT